MLQNGVVRAVKALSPVNVSVDTNHVEVWLNQSALDATPVIAALQTTVAGKQSQLYAGDVAEGHPLLLQPGLFVGGGFDEGQQPLPGDTVRALKVSAPLVATSDNTHVHVSLAPDWSPVFCAGRVNANATVASSVGRVGYTVLRPNTFGTGVYRITFNTPAPNNNYVISLMQLGSGSIKIWDSTDVPGGLPTTTTFHAITYDVNGTTVKNYDFLFSVLV
jgi:hypothetical protein